MHNKIVKSGFSSVLQIVTSSLGYVAVYVFVIMRLGKAQLGIWAIITAVPAAVAFLGSGVSGSLLRYIPIYVSDQQDQFVKKIIFNGFLFNLVLGMSIVVVAYLFAVPIMKLMFGVEEIPAFYKDLFTLSLCTFFVNFINSVSLAALDGLQRIVEKNHILMVSSLLFCCFGLLLLINFNLEGLFYAQLIQALLTSMLSFTAIYRAGYFEFKTSNFHRDLFRLFYTYGGRLQYISILNILFEPITKFFLNRYFGLGTVGIYDLANRIVGQLRMTIVSAVQVIVPFIATQNDADNANDEEIYGKSLKGALLLSAILFGSLLTLGFSVGSFFEKINASEFQLMLLYLTLGYVLNILSAPAYAMRLAKGQLTYLVTAQQLSTGLNILFFVLLGLWRQQFFMLLPTALAIGLSSLYVIKTYRVPLTKALRLTINDRCIVGLNLIFPFVCLASKDLNRYLLLTLAGLQLLTLVVLMANNGYLKNVIRILVAKKKKQTGQ